MAAFPNQEQRPLKKPRLGPPDVYHQEQGQKEDELTAVSVKQGFSNPPLCENECGTAKNVPFTQAKIGAYFTAIVAKKNELNALQDTSKKKHLINPKENFWPVTARSKQAIETWFTDLSGTKSLTLLGKKVPLFNKKEEIFTTLCEYNVPMVRAAWFIKMTNAHTVANISESKIKKRQIVDPSLEWTSLLTKFLKEQLQKMSEHYHGPSTTGPQTGFLTVTQTPHIDIDQAMKHWHYGSRLARHMYEEGLLDRHEFLTWLSDIMDKQKNQDDSILKIMMVQILQYVDDFILSQMLSRKLAVFCCKRLYQMCNDSGYTSPRTQSPLVTANANGTLTTASANPPNPVMAVLGDYTTCPQHRALVLGLAAVLQTITLQCPSALVWNNLGDGKGDGKSSSPLCGSPLDYLPCAPSSLPMPPSPSNGELRNQLRCAEQVIKLRGQAAEVRWSSDKYQQSTTGFTINRVLTALEALDRHNFECVESTANLDTVYSKVFSTGQGKDQNELPQADEALVHLLCEWAVSSERTGAHRAIVVARLLERRQNELANEKMQDSDILDEKESLGSEAMAPGGLPVFQNLLMQFLDTRAPVLDSDPTPAKRVAFANLVSLFCELIHHDVFSHDAYMCTLISRGDLESSPPMVPTSDGMADLASVKSEIHSVKQQEAQDDPPRMDLDNQLDDIFKFCDDKSSPDMPSDNPAAMLLELQQHLGKSSPEHVIASVKSEKETPSASTSMMGTADLVPGKRPCRHLLYVTHFPIPRDDSAYHDCNQRMIVLYGVGKARDEARHIVKKVTKEIMKLFSKKNSIDISSGDVGKTKKKKEKGDRDSDSASTNFESTFSKFEKLSFYDQHDVSSSCASQVLEQFNSFSGGNSSYLPLVDNISYLFDLMEHCQNINGLIDFCISLLKELSEVEVQLMMKGAQVLGSYITSLCLCIVAVLRRYHAYLLVMQDQTMDTFEGLCRVVKHVSNPSDCSSAERCILAYLYDLYTSCSYLKAKYSDFFASASSKVQQTLYVSISPTASNLLWEKSFMSELLENPKSKVDLTLVKQLNDNAACRYSFVCNAVLMICNSPRNSPGIERLNEISILCAELTACCNVLSSEWLGILKVLCCSANHSCGFLDVLTLVDVGDLSIHDSLSVFTAILIARHCFSLQDLVVHVALPSLLAACASTGGDQEAEPGARLTCHLLLRLFKSTHSHTRVPLPSVRQVCSIKASSDRHLLAAAHNNISIGPVIAVLKAILVLGDSISGDRKSGSGGGKNQSGDIITTLLSSLDDDTDMDMMLGGTGAKSHFESAGLSDFAKHALKEICSQEWVREKFLKDTEGLFTQDLLLDPLLSHSQARRLVHLICYPEQVPIDEGDYNLKENIKRLLQNLNQWSLRMTWLELQLMFKQASSSETSSLLNSIASATIEIFQQVTENSSSSEGQQQTRTEVSPPGVWLVAPLISKLPSFVQGRVLKSAGQVLESGNNFWLNKNKSESDKKSTSLLSQQPFLSLVLTCLKGQDEQRADLLSSLHSQLEKFINNAKEGKLPDECRTTQVVQDALQLRLSLAGGMLDTVQRNSVATTDWAILLLQLIAQGVIDTQNNSELFYNVLDMLSVLIHGTLVTDGSSDKDDSRKVYSTLIRKLKKELGDRYSDGISQVRQLLPIPKSQCEFVIACEPHGCLVDSKGNKIAGFDSIDKKQGLQVASKQRVKPWEMIEGLKNSGSLNWGWFGAVKLERKPLKYEEQHRLLLYHSHSLKKALSYYLDPPPLPPEDLEPPPEVKPEEKPQETKVVESVTKKPPQRKRRQSRAASSTYNTSPLRGHMSGGYQDMYGGSQPPHNWPLQQPSYGYSQQPMPTGMRNAGGPRFGGHNLQSKAALSNMLRARLPSVQGYNPTQTQPAAQNLQMLQKQRMVRMQLRAQHERNLERMYGQSAMQTANQPLHHLPQQGISQNYPNYNMGSQQQPSMMDTGNTSSMMGGPSYGNAPGYQQSGMAQPPMHSQGPHSGYLSHQPNQQRGYGQNPGMQPSMPQGNMQGPNMNQMAPSGYNQMGPNPNQQQLQSSYMQNLPTPSQQRLQQMRQNQLMQQQQQQALLQQQQQSRQQQHLQQTQQQQQTAALVAQLKRQLSGAPQQVQQQPQQQYNTYPNPPQY